MKKATTNKELGESGGHYLLLVVSGIKLWRSQKFCGRWRSTPSVYHCGSSSLAVLLAPLWLARRSDSGEIHKRSAWPSNTVAQPTRSLASIHTCHRDSPRTNVNSLLTHSSRLNSPEKNSGGWFLFLFFVVFLLHRLRKKTRRGIMRRDNRCFKTSLHKLFQLPCRALHRPTLLPSDQILCYSGWRWGAWWGPQLTPTSSLHPTVKAD